MRMPGPHTQRKLLAHLLSILLVVSTIVSLPVLANDCTGGSNKCPYVKVSNGDVAAGGWINDGALSCATDPNYQAPDFSGGIPAPSTQYKGGILTFANANTVNGNFINGSAADFGALALGQVEGHNTGSDEPYGFGSGQKATPPPKNYNYLTFASSGGTNWGGYFEGEGHNGYHCLPDYFNTKLNLQCPSDPNCKAPPFSWSDFTPAPTKNGQYFYDGNITIGSNTITAAQRLTIFVNGDVTITGGDINYDSRNSYSVDNIPQFIVVALGNIYIDPGVHEIDGFYIAQPTSGSGPTDPSGEIWTCSDGTDNAFRGDWVQSNCNNSLTVRGALAAKRVNLSRIGGDIGTINSPAENIIYTPEMLLGGQLFNPPAASFSQAVKLDSLKTLPPLF